MRFNLVLILFIFCIYSCNPIDKNKSDNNIIVRTNYGSSQKLLSYLNNFIDNDTTITNNNDTNINNNKIESKKK